MAPSLPLPFLLLLLLFSTIALASWDPVTAPEAPRRSLRSGNSSSSSHRTTGQKVGPWIGGFVLGSVVGVLAGGLSSVLFRLLIGIYRGSFRDQKGPEIFSSLIRKADLEFLEADDGIAGCEQIGQGGCGKVYRAVLGSDGRRVVAIKQIEKLRWKDATVDIGAEESRLLDKRMRQLRSEIKTVGHIRHRNLVPLLAHVSRPDCHYLVYEFMKNGSLQDALCAVKEGRGELPWPERLRIARGIAAGLEYLHTQHRPRIIHRDLKPGNILLDDNLEARIADFGLAKAVPDADTHMTTSNVAGTPGYIAPEYHQMLRFTDKCDMYSFGVILGVLVTGKTPSDGFFQETDDVSMVKWMRKIVVCGEADALEEAADRWLLGGGHEAQMFLVLKVACLCTVEDPKSRPGSKDVRCMLDQILVSSPS